MNDKGSVVWLAGWYATRLHAVIKDNADGWADNPGFRPVCGRMGSYVYRKPQSEWAAKRILEGVPRCKRCEKILAQRGYIYDLEGLQDG